MELETENHVQQQEQEEAENSTISLPDHVDTDVNQNIVNENHVQTKQDDEMTSKEGNHEAAPSTNIEGNEQQEGGEHEEEENHLQNQTHPEQESVLMFSRTREAVS